MYSYVMRRIMMVYAPFDICSRSCVPLFPGASTATIAAAACKVHVIIVGQCIVRAHAVERRLPNYSIKLIN